MVMRTVELVAFYSGQSGLGFGPAGMTCDKDGACPARARRGQAKRC